MREPLGIAVVSAWDEDIVIVHVAVDVAGASPVGMWKLPHTQVVELRSLLVNWVCVGPMEAVTLLGRIVQEKVPCGSLDSFAQEGSDEYAALIEEFTTYKEAAPKKRASLVPPRAIGFPTLGPSWAPVLELERLGKSAYSDTCPEESQEAIAGSRLVQLLATKWNDLETDRLARTYLTSSLPPRRLLPPRWAMAAAPLAPVPAQ